MSAEARYYRVGLFVFGGLLLIGSFAVILGGGDWFQEKLLVETYFDEAVGGLEIGSPVKVRGVQLGTVSKIGFVNEVYELKTEKEDFTSGQMIYVLMDVTPRLQDISEEERRRRLAALIGKEGLRLRLSTGLLTGTSFIQADFLSPESHPPMEISWEPRHLYIPSAPSMATAISSAAERIFERLEDVEVEKVVENLDELLVTLNDQVGALDVAGLNASAEHVLEQANASLVRTRRLLEGSEYDVQVALENLRVATENLRDLTDTAKQYPSLLILGEPPQPTDASAR